jgi:hypothetical protein
LIALKAGLREACEKLRALQANVLLEFTIARKQILNWFRSALAQHDQLLQCGIRSRQKNEAELQSAILELRQKKHKIDPKRKWAESAEK